MKITAQEYRERRDNVYDKLNAEGYLDIDISLAILGERNAPEALKNRAEILALRHLIHTVTNL
jgi:3-deoxy-D-manno-octulosonate 8-phosphate phosphatase KdsC-like HAD superfamily phosphatase